MSDLPHLLIDYLPIFNDNYIWVIGLNSADKTANIPHQNSIIMIDPGDEKAAAAYLKKHNKTLAGIVITHSHSDHVGGVNGLLSNKSVWADSAKQPVYGHQSIACVNTPVDHLPSFTPWPLHHVAFNIIPTPGHMPEHLSYFIDNIPHTHHTEQVNNYALFCGDTLFHAGCGRIFNGTAKELQNSLDTLQSLPDKTQVYCTHEYTQSNMAFAMAIEPNNTQLLQTSHNIDTLRAQHRITLPTTIQTQKAINPFLRYRLPHVQSQIAHLSAQNINNDDDAFRLLRVLKDTF